MSRLPAAAAALCALAILMPARAGRVERASLRSALLGRTIEYVVILPDSYETKRGAGTRFPVLYLLHCAGCRAWDWTNPDYGARVDLLVDSVRYIVAAPDDGDVLGWWLDSPVKRSSAMHTFLVTEFKGLIDSLYATLPGRAHTGLAGHSMGGFGALHNLIESPGVFSAAYSIKGAVDLMPYPNNWGLDAVLGSQARERSNWLAADIVTNACRLAGRSVAIRFYSGPNDWFGEGNRRLDSALSACGVAHGYVTTAEEHFRVPQASMRSVMMFFDSVFAAAPAAVKPGRKAGSGAPALKPRPAPRPGMLNLRGQREREEGAGPGTGEPAGRSGWRR